MCYLNLKTFLNFLLTLINFTSYFMNNNKTKQQQQLHAFKVICNDMCPINFTDAGKDFTTPNLGGTSSGTRLIDEARKYCNESNK